MAQAGTTSNFTTYMARVYTKIFTPRFVSFPDSLLARVYYDASSNYGVLTLQHCCYVLCTYRYSTHTGDQ